MEISFLRAKRIALVSLLKAEKRRQQEREAEAEFYSDESAQQSVQADVLITCANCGAYHSIYIPCPAGSAQVARR